MSSTGEIARYLSNSLSEFRTLDDVERYQDKIRKLSEHLYGRSLFKDSSHALFVEDDRFVRDQLIEIEIAIQKHSTDLHKLIPILVAIDKRITARVPPLEEGVNALATFSWRSG
jgi:hypothetical protein